MHTKLLQPRRLFFARGKGWAVPGSVVAADSINVRARGVGSNGTLPLVEFKRAVACYKGQLNTEVRGCKSTLLLKPRHLGHWVCSLDFQLRHRRGILLQS